MCDVGLAAIYTEGRLMTEVPTPQSTQCGIVTTNELVSAMCPIHRCHITHLDTLNALETVTKKNDKQGFIKARQGITFTLQCTVHHYCSHYDYVCHSVKFNFDQYLAVLLEILMCRAVSQDESSQVLSLLEEAPDTGP